MTLLVDHDNIPFDRVTVRAILERWIRAAHLASAVGESGVVDLRVRAYGGWFEGSTSSAARFAAMDFYQGPDGCPSILKHGGLFCRVAFEFAEQLVAFGPNVRVAGADAGLRITHTVATRASPHRIVASADAATCQQPDCQLQMVRRWLRKKRACTLRGCPHSFSDFFSRKEQKQVDVHLAVDLVGFVSSTAEPQLIGVVSDDADLLPAILFAAQHKPTGCWLFALRFSSASSYMDSVLRDRGVRILDLSTDGRETGP
jgi:hypothetical protein